MAVTVDPKKIARAISRATSRVETPAAEPETTPKSTPVLSAPSVPDSQNARALPTSKPRERPPAPNTEAKPATEPRDGSPPSDPVLFTIRQLGRLLDDIEQMRIMNGNRVGAGQRAGIDLPWMGVVGAQLDTLEHSVELELKRAWRKHPLAKWAKGIPGAGEILMARLIAEIGDPADRPNPGKLLAYCGHGDPARAGKIPKGATQEELFKRGNPRAKKATWKLAYQFMRTVGTPARASEDAESIARTPARANMVANSTPQTPARARSPYRDLYEQRKADTEGKLHERACVRCGPAGHRAAAGSPWSDAHRHADALRIVGKQFLIDLWVAAKETQG